MKVWVKGSGTSVTLGQRDYVASGGQGNIYARGGTTYKVYHDAKDMIPMGKVTELSALTDPKIIRPQQILVDKGGKPVGYTTNFIKDAYVLCQLFPKAFRNREGVTHDMTQALVRKMQEGIQHIHKHGILVVDMNEMNFLVDHGFNNVYFIDVDSYQTKGYKAPAIMESIRDWQVQNHAWTPMSDWYSFAVLTFQMFIGLHPFRGRYQGKEDKFKSKLPGDAPDDSFAITRRRMQGNISVLHQDVGYPQGPTYPMSVVPAAYMAWYKAVFEQGIRCAPPADFSAAIIIMPVIKTVSGTASLDILQIGNFDGTVAHTWSTGMNLVVASDKGVWVDNNRAPTPGTSILGCGFSPHGDKPVLAETGPDGLVLTNLASREQVPFALQSQETVSHDGRLYVRAEDKVYELVLTDAGNKVIASTRPVVNVLPHASRLYQGVVVQNMLGSVFVSLLTGPGEAQQVRVKELDEYKVLDAKFDGGVLMVVGAKVGKYDRMVFRFDGDQYDMRTVDNITPTGLNFVTLDTGVCVCLNEEEKLELCSSRRGSQSLKYVEDTALKGDMLLGKQGGSVIFSQGGKVYTMKMK